MSNSGKFTDRFPIICAAGKVTEPNTSVRETFREYHSSEIDDIKNKFKINNEKNQLSKNKLPIVENCRHRGTHDLILQHLSNPVKTRYQQLIDDLKETTYESYWKRPLGKSPDQVPAFPTGTDINEITFGHPPTKHTPLYEVILPNKTRYQVLSDSQINHDNYKKIYNDYNVGERIDRNYYKPPFNPNNRFGSKRKNINVNKGMGVACAMEWFNTEPTTIATKRQSDYCNTHKIRIGKVHAPIGSHKNVPVSHVYGKPLEHGMYGVEELLKPRCDPAIYKKITLERMASLNLLRQKIKRMYSPTFNLKDLSDKFDLCAQKGADFIALEDFYYVVESFGIKIKDENIRALFEDVGIIQDDKINYQRFLDAKNFDMELGTKLDPLPKNKLHFMSQSTAANLDRCIVDNYTMYPVAGLSSHRYDLKIPPKKSCESERDDLPTDDVKTLLNRSIFLQYNISYRDMFKSRSKNFIRNLFEKCGYHFADESFDTLYKMASSSCGDENGGVSVDDFYKVLRKNLPPMKKIVVDEMDACSKIPQIPCFYNRTSTL